jgi:hypothetical protein
MIQGHEYIFSYMTNKNSLTFDGFNVLVKQGPFRKTNFAFASIINWYVFDEKTYRSLYITYTTEASKVKKVQLISQLGEPGFRDIVEALNTSIPNKSLNHLPREEAFKVMKAMNPKKAGAIGGIILIFVLTTAFMYPGIRHYLDFGFADADVEQLINGDDFGTRNLNLYGRPLEETLESTTTKNGSTQSVEYFVPIVGADWDYDQPVQVIMKFDKMNEDEFNELYDNVEFKGVVRNIGFEGIEDDEKEFFGTEYNLKVSDDVILFEVTGEKHNDSLMFFLWLGLNGLFIIIFGIVYLKNRK